MIDSGQIDYALVVNGEDARDTQEATHRPAREPGDATAEDVLAQFATLTLGSGAAAMVLGRADAHPEGHRFVGGVARAGTEHHELCVGDLDCMRTDTTGLLDAGLALSVRHVGGRRAGVRLGADMDRYVIHQVSQVHTRAICEALDIDPRRVPLTLPDARQHRPGRGAVHPGREADSLRAGDRVLLMGIGSGLNASCAEIVW